MPKVIGEFCAAGLHREVDERAAQRAAWRGVTLQWLFAHRASGHPSTTKPVRQACLAPNGILFWV